MPGGEGLPSPMGAIARCEDRGGHCAARHGHSCAMSSDRSVYVACCSDWGATGLRTTTGLGLLAIGHADHLGPMSGASATAPIGAIAIGCELVFDNLGTF